MNNKVIMLISLVFIFSGINAYCQKKYVDVDQSIVQTAIITEEKLIKFLVEDFMIPEEKIRKIVIYDLSGDGFGEFDIARTYPGGRFYLLTPSKKAQTIMNKWSFGGNVKFTANLNDPAECFENSPDSVRAMGGIFAALLRGLRRNYSGEPIKLHLEQKNDVTTFEIWDYKQKLMKYEAPPINKIPQKVPVMKLIYLEKTVVDSIYTSRND